MEQKQQLRHLNLQVNRKLTQCLLLAERHFNCTFVRPAVNYKLRGVKAGVAYLQQWEIRLNPILLLENDQRFIEQVVPHELAHLLVYQQFGRVKPHGIEWQHLMQNVFGVPAETRHQFEVKSVQGQTFPYQCACQTHHLTARRHQKIQQQGIQYFCKKCKKQLHFVTLS
ncbi:SprT family zinc-dependent metalloprotease [Gallibacterium anatis]|uniref:Protein SprT n=1 Tax=Gallibacterium anatis 4895 TaxID=1396510 RepID=A0A0A2ZXU1_9PAST|nr:SprT family zinc-dependent metalloprotease [Gallibacterium anatis]KGQ59630.1 sprT [Gallibacterium anatis 4895]